MFQSLVGIAEVRQGFIRSDPPDDDWSEAVEVTYDPAKIGLKDLITVHLATHASTADHKMRGKYRSAIYVHDLSLVMETNAIVARLGEEAGTRFVTRVLVSRGFKSSAARFHNYYRTDPEKPFCKTYIDPKLAKMRRRFAAVMSEAG